MPASLKSVMKKSDKPKRSYRKRVPLNRPLCPRCGSVMVVYTTRNGGKSTVRYWRCWRYPQCRCTAKKDE